MLTEGGLGGVLDEDATRSSKKSQLWTSQRPLANRPSIVTSEVSLISSASREHDRARMKTNMAMHFIITEHLAQPTPVKQKNNHESFNMSHRAEVERS